MCDYKDADQLALLMEYTSSHMMMFTGLIAAAASAYYYLKSRFNFKKENLLPTVLLIIAGVCFISAGIAIGMIASYIPHFKNFEQFKIGNNGSLEMLIKYKYLEKAENYGFWLSILFSILAIGFSKKPNQDEQKKL